MNEGKSIWKECLTIVQDFEFLGIIQKCLETTNLIVYFSYVNMLYLRALSGPRDVCGGFFDLCYWNTLYGPCSNQKRILDVYMDKLCFYTPIPNRTRSWTPDPEGIKTHHEISEEQARVQAGYEVKILRLVYCKAICESVPLVYTENSSKINVMNEWSFNI